MRTSLQLWGREVLIVPSGKIRYFSFWTAFFPLKPEPWKGQRLSEQFEKFQGLMEERTQSLQEPLAFPHRKAAMRVLPSPHQSHHEIDVELVAPLTILGKRWLVR